MADQDKPSTLEDEYFAREDIEKKRKLAFEQSRATAQQQREALQALHHMKCPKCGMDLQSVKRGDIEIDACFNCHGVFLDSGELERLQHQMSHEKDGRWMGAVLNLFKNK